MRSILSQHRAFAIVLAAFIALSIAYSITTPLFEAPDEQWHFAFVQYIAQGHGLPVQKPGQADHLARQEASQPPLYYLVAAAATFWIDTSDFPGIVWENPHYGFAVPGIVNDNKNLFIHTAQENFPWHNTPLAVHLARFISILFGALAILGTYLLALEIFSYSFSGGGSHAAVARRVGAPPAERKTLAATGAAAFVAFVPQFLFISGAVSNDSAIVAMCALALWLMARYVIASEAKQSPDEQLEIASSHPSTRFARSGSLLAMTPSVVLGLVAGLAALAKVSGLGISVLAAAVIIFVYRRKFRALVINFSLFAFSFLLIAGWWYARNYFLYGELTGAEMMLGIFGARVSPLSFAQFAAQLSEVWETFWVGFGWGNVRAPAIVYAFFGLLIAISAVGWVLELWKGINARRVGRERPSTFAIEKIFLVLALWLAITVAAFLRWMLITQAPHGRLLFPALPALAPLVVFGWTRFAKHPRSRDIAALVPSFALGAVALFALFALLRPAYAFPTALAESDLAKIPNRVDIGYDGKMKLLGYNVSPQRALPDGSVTLTLYWQALAPMDEDYSIGIALLNANRKILSQRNSYPGHGMLPTRLWRAGQMIQDQYWVPIPANAPAPSMAQIQISLFKRETQKDLPAFDPKGNAITPIVGRFKIGSPLTLEARPQNRTEYVFGNQIQLIGYDVNRDEVILYWKRVVPMQNDYTVFVHWLDVDEKIIAQQDAEPSVPTSLWDDGEIFAEHYARGSNRVRIGIYRADTGERLRAGNDDNVILGVGQ